MISRAAAKVVQGKFLPRSNTQGLSGSVAVAAGNAMPPTAKSPVTGNVVVLNENEEQQLMRAKGYPYARPDTSFLFVAGDVLQFDNDQWRGLNHLSGITGRCGSFATDFAAARGVDLVAMSREQLFVPVLAIGSNAGPEQLRRKYPTQDFPDCVIPVVKVALEDFDVVYTPYIATYGSCTATLEHSPGTVTSIFITYLTAPLMERMHATEGGYNLCRLSGLRLHVAPRNAGPLHWSTERGKEETHDEGTAVAEAEAQLAFESFEVRDWVYQYNHKLGCIELPLEGLGGSPVAIGAIPAERRAFPSVSQVQMLSAINNALGSAAAGSLTPMADLGLLPDDEMVLDEWILHLIRDPTVRSRINKRLAKYSRPFSYPDTEVVVAL